ncbi:MAG: autotransporter domain-containing protein [Planctomycetaceae bacterium]|jgi:hypothetical protein|nr:autotransporter domain-containing protein [Planctomycetaceae bacterium]
MRSILAILPILIIALALAQLQPNITCAQGIDDTPSPLYDSDPAVPKPTFDTTIYGANKFGVDDTSELNTVLAMPLLNKWILLEDNIVVPNTQVFDLKLNGDEKLVIELDMDNLQTDSDFIFKKTNNGKADVTIIGSSMFANGGLDLQGKINFNYFGTYTSGRADILASTNSDEITFNLLGKNSLWDAQNGNPHFINRLPISPENYETGTIVIGEEGKAIVNIASGNIVKSGEVIIGARNGSEGALNLSGVYKVNDTINEGEIIQKSTTWDNTGTIYIGYHGKGTANIHHGATLKAGSIGIGISDDITNGIGNGTLNITGIGEFLDIPKNQNYIIHKGTPLNEKDKDYITDATEFNKDTTHIYIYGRDDENKNNFLFNTGGDPNGPLKSLGNGIMNIANGAIIEFDETKSLSGEPTNFTPKITLGEDNSTIDNSLIIGARDAFDKDEPGYNNFDDVGLIDGTDASGALQNNSLTFKNKSVLQGNLKIHMGQIKFEDNSVLSPGFGSYQFYMSDDPSIKTPDDLRFIHENFGRIEFKNNTFIHDPNATTIIDFDVHGDRNYRTDPAKQTAYFPAGKDNLPYAGDPGHPNKVTNIYGDDALYQGRDLIMVNGNANLEGKIYFRPQTGYYSDKIAIDFMRVTGTIDGQYDLHLYPYRWFKNAYLDKSETFGGITYNQLKADRNTTPFTDVARNYNQRGVGGALNNIFNAQDNYKWLPILDWFWLMNDDELREAERLVSGEIKASSFYMPIRSPWRFGFDRTNWSDKGHKIYFGPQNYNNPQTQKHTLWATAYFDYQSIDNDHNNSNMATQRVSLMTGYDRVLPNSFDVGIFSDSAVGAVFSYSQPKLDQKGNRVVTDDFLAGFHSATRIASIYELKSWISFGAQKYRLHRYIPIPNQTPDIKASYKGNSFATSIQLARPVKWYGLTFRPHGAIDVSYVKQYDAYESYTGDVMKQIALHYHQSDWTQTFARIGLRLDYARNCFNISATLGYSYLLLGQQAPKTTHEFTHAGGGKFNILGNNLNRSFANVDISSQLHLNKLKTKSLYIQYNGNYSKYMNAHTTAIGYQFLY